jgi:hypothetical protein
MGIFSALFGDGFDDVKQALSSFKYKEGMPEGKFRDALPIHLSNSIPSVMPKRESAIHGEGTRVDIAFEHQGEDFIFTIKQGLSEQKTKILLGEAVVLAQALIAMEHRRKSHVLVMLIADHVREEAFAGHIKTLHCGFVFLNARCKDSLANMDFHLVLATTGETEVISLE